MTREQFCTELAQQANRLDLDDVQLARLFQVSRPPIGRWLAGVAAPHPVGRSPILAALRSK